MRLRARLILIGLMFLSAVGPLMADEQSKSNDPQAARQLAERFADAVN